MVTICWGLVNSMRIRVSCGLTRFTTIVPESTSSTFTTSVCAILRISAVSPLKLIAASSRRASTASNGGSAAAGGRPPRLAAAPDSSVQLTMNKVRNHVIAKPTPLIEDAPADSGGVPSLLACERHIPLQFPFQIENRLDPGDRQPPVAHARLQGRGELGDALVLGDSRQQLRIHNEDRHPVFRRQHGNAAGMRNARLVAVPVARRQKDERQDDGNHHIVLPARPRILPQNESLQHLLIQYCSSNLYQSHAIEKKSPDCNCLFCYYLAILKWAGLASATWGCGLK